MKWETIKENAIRDLTYQINTPFDSKLTGLIGVEAVKRIIESRDATFKTLKAELSATIREVVNRVDIRSYKDLLKIAPKAFPSCARNGKASIELTANGWEILPVIEDEKN
jgi:hypothetical protein